MFKTAQQAGLYKRVQRTPSKVPNNVVLHANQEQCCFEDWRRSGP